MTNPIVLTMPLKTRALTAAERDSLQRRLARYQAMQAMATEDSRRKLQVQIDAIKRQLEG